MDPFLDPFFDPLFPGYAHAKMFKKSVFFDPPRRGGTPPQEVSGPPQIGVGTPP